MMTSTPDVLVVGAGPAGAAVALRCAASGHAVELVDRDRFPRAKVCGCCLADRGVAALRDLGLGNLVDEGTPLHSVEICTTGRRVELPFRGSVVLSRERLDHALVEAARDRGVIVHERTRATVRPDGTVETVELRQAARQHDSCPGDVRRKIRRGVLHARHDGLDDDLYALCERGTDVDLSNGHGPRKAGVDVSAPHLECALIGLRERSPELVLERLGRHRADGDPVVRLEVANDGRVHVITADLHRPTVDDTAQRNHSNLGVASTEVHNHLAARLFNRKSRPRSRSERLFDQVNGSCARRLRQFPHCPLLDFCRSIGNAHGDARADPEPATLHRHHLVAQEGLRHIKLGDEPIPERSDNTDISWRTTKHGPGVVPNGHDVPLPPTLVEDRHRAGRAHEPASAADQDTGLESAHVDRHVTRHRAEYRVEHLRLGEVREECGARSTAVQDENHVQSV